MTLTNCDVCRLCLSEDVQFEDIFNASFDDLPKKIFIFAETQVILGDGYSSLVCFQCLESLQEFWNFRATIQTTQTVLKKYIYTVPLPLGGTKSLKAVKTNSQVPEEELFSDENEDDNISIEENISEYSYSSELDNESSCDEEYEEEKEADETTKRKQRILQKNVNEQCYECGKIFKSAGYLAHHMRVHSGHRPYQCKVCHKTFSQNSALVVHSRRHSGDKPYICTICGKGFTQSGNLSAHNRSHTGEKPYKCEVCSKTFSQVGNLYIHKRIHTGVREHSCKVCKKAFKFPSHLAEHMKTHDENKQHHCSICNKGFHKGSYLSTHMRIHTGEKPYKCEHCGKCFSNSSNLTAHIRIHTGSKPYVCSFCNKGFAQSSAMVRHEKQHKVDQKCKISDMNILNVTDYFITNTNGIDNKSNVLFMGNDTIDNSTTKKINCLHQDEIYNNTDQNHYMKLRSTVNTIENNVAQTASETQLLLNQVEMRPERLSNGQQNMFGTNSIHIGVDTLHPTIFLPQL